MDMEKRDAGQQPVSAKEPNKRQPVIGYIMILFIVALMLMMLSAMMHQRSNTEQLGQLQNSVNAMQAVQETQEKVISLQEDLAKADDQIEALEKKNAETEQAVADAEKYGEALLALYNLQQDYLTEDFDGCRDVIAYMEANGLVDLLPKKAIDSATSPAIRFMQLKEAVLNK